MLYNTMRKRTRTVFIGLAYLVISLAAVGFWLYVAGLAILTLQKYLGG